MDVSRSSVIPCGDLLNVLKSKKGCSLSVLDIYRSSFILCEDLLNVYTALLSVHTAHLSVVCTERIGCISLFFYSMQGSFQCIKKRKSGVH